MSKKKIEFRIGSCGWTVILKPGNPITLCEIREDYEGGMMLAYGLGVRKPADPYDKETGCRRALEAALRQSLYPGALPIQEQYTVVAEDIWARYYEAFPREKRPTESQILIRWFKNLMVDVERWQKRGESAVEYPWPPMNLIDRAARAMAIADSLEVKKARAKRKRKQEAQREGEEQR